MKFYNVKTRTSVEIEEKDIRKKVFVGKNGQKRYAVRATLDGTNLTKFISKETYDALNVPEEA